MTREAQPAQSSREPIEVAIVKEWIAKALPSDAEGDWHAKFSPAAMSLVDAILTSDAHVIEGLTDPLRDAIAALERGDDAEQVQRQIGYLCGLMAVMRWWSQRTDGGAVDAAGRELVEARTFLASVAGASAQGTMEQSEWMIAQAREGLRRAGGHDFDA